MLFLTEISALWRRISVRLREGLLIASEIQDGNTKSLPPDQDHPFGYGRELYFWSFIVALLLFNLGAGVSFYQGIAHIKDPHPIEQPIVNYIVLGCSAIFEFGSWTIAFKEFRQSKGKLDYYEARLHQAGDAYHRWHSVDRHAVVLGVTAFMLAGQYRQAAGASPSLIE